MTTNIEAKTANAHPECAFQTFTGTYGAWEFTCSHGQVFKLDRGIRGFGYKGTISFDKDGNGFVEESKETNNPIKTNNPTIMVNPSIMDDLIGDIPFVE